MFYVLLSHGNAVLPNWTLKGSLCSNCTTPLWVGFITPRCYICQFDQNIVWYKMQWSFVTNYVPEVEERCSVGIGDEATVVEPLSWL